jgi:hypothetical protein
VTVDGSDLTTLIKVVIKFASDTEKMAVFEVNISDNIVETISALVSTTYNVGGTLLFEG